MFKIEKTRPAEPDLWQYAEREQAIAQARTQMLTPGDVVTVTSADTGETLWMGVVGRDGACHEWYGNEPGKVHISPPMAKAA